MKRRQHIINGIAGALIVLWVYAAGSKLWFYTAFAIQLQRQPLPTWSVPILRLLLPLTELAAAGLLCFQRTRGKGFLLSLGLMLAFTLYVGLGLLHVYKEVPCSCGGILGRMGWGAHLVFNIVFTIVGAAGVYLFHTEEKRGQRIDNGHRIIDNGG